MMKIGNDVMKVIFRSRLHSLFSQNTLLITLIGCKTGRAYSLPVNYVQDGESLYITGQRYLTWWRSLRGHKLVRVWLRGRELDGEGIAVEETTAVSAGLKRFFQLSPKYAK